MFGKIKQQKQQNSYEPRLVYITVFFTGMVTLILEIVGTRVLAPFYGSTIYVWSSMITISLGALSAGYFFGGNLSEKLHKGKVFSFGRMKLSGFESSLGLIIALSGFFIFLISKIDNYILLISNGLGIKMGPLFVSLVLFGPALFLLGGVTPICIRHLTRKVSDSGLEAGKIFAVATLGSLLGSILAGFVLIPLFPISQIFLFLSIILFVVSLVWVKGKNILFRFILFLGIVSIMASSYQPNLNKISPPSEVYIVYKEPSFFGDIKVYELTGFKRNIRCLLIDTSSQSCWNFDNDESAWPYTRYFRGAVSTFPLGEKLDILIVGLGGGAVVKELEKSGHNIDVVEIDPRVIRIAKQYFELPENENINYIIGDARRYIKQTNKKYDLIMVDIVIGTEPSLHLATVEFFEDAKNVLNPDGIVSTNAMGWIQSQDLQPVVYKTQKQVFDTVKFSVRQPGEYGSIVYYATDKEIEEQDFLGMIPNLFDEEYLYAYYDYDSMKVLTDDYNPSYSLDLPTIVYGREVTLQSFGEEFYLYDPNKSI